MVAVREEEFGGDQRDRRPQNDPAVPIHDYRSIARRPHA